MTTRKSGLLGLILGMAFLAACDQKAPIVQVPPPDTTPTITLNLVPEAATIEVGRTVTLVPVVTGTTNQAVTFSSSNTAVATVSAAGVVTGVAAGTAVISAVSSADPRARDASTITVTAPPIVIPPAPPSINIASITSGGTLFPVNTQNIQGQIDITVNADIPVGSNVARLEVLVDNAVACSQSFTGTGGAGDLSTDGAQVPVQIVCSVNTAAYNATTGAPTYANGPHTISARLIGANGATVASATSQQVIFNNPSFLVVGTGARGSLNYFVPGTTTARACANAGTDNRTLAGPGAQWCGGDVQVNILPVIFGTADQQLARVTVNLHTSGIGTNGVAACDARVGAAPASGMIAPEDVGAATTLENGAARATTSAGTPFSAATGAVVTNTDVDGDGFMDFPGCGAVTVTRTDTDASNGFSVTFPAGTDPDDATTGVQDIEDFVAITITGVTVGGQAGPLCVNPDAALNPLQATATVGACGSGAAGASVPGTAFFQNPLRLDNAPPRVTLFDLTPAACTTTACFVNGTFSFAPRAGFFVSRDYGVDAQNANTFFEAGASTTSLARVSTGADLAETVTANDILVRATVADALGNSQSVYATAVGANPAVNNTTTTDATAAQRIGVDRTAPEVDATLTVTPPNNGANDGLSFAIAFRDTGVGPSGFGAAPVWVKVEFISTQGTFCISPTTGTRLSATTSGCASGAREDGTVATTGTFTTPAANGAGITSGEGYYRYTFYVEDAAGNRTATQVVTTLIDVTAPGVAGIVAPSIITGNTATTFSASTTDNVDLGDVTPYVGFLTVGRYLEEARATIGTYGPDALTTSATATATVANFIRSIETTSGAGVPTGAIDRADQISFNVRDVAGVVDNVACPAVGAPNTSSANCTNRTDDITAALTAGIPAGTTGNGERSFANANIGVATFTLAANNLTVCNSTGTGAGQPCPTNPSTTTLTATATGPTATFGNPFARVNFYYVNPATGRAVLIGTATGPSVTDVAGTRSFVWQTTWNPATLGAAGYTVFAIGVHSSGMGLQSPDVVITVAVD